MKNRKKIIKVIYNPHAGKKRNITSLGTQTTLEEIKSLFKKYQLDADFYPTKRKLHATELAIKAKKEGYKIIVAAGGDGTISETANGLINSKLTLAIIPLGTFMNIPKMLSIPTDLEKAIMLIKIGRTRKIDVGVIKKIGGDRLTVPHYFLETAGIGIDAKLQEEFLEFEQGKLSNVLKMIKTILDFFARRVKVTIDGKKLPVMRSTMITVANGPFTAANLELAPEALLNDHMLTVSIYTMKKFDFVKYFIKFLFKKKHDKRKIKLYKARDVLIETFNPYPVHADASVFGTTPAEFKILPNALEVITGFPEEDSNFLKKRTVLDP